MSLRQTMLSSPSICCLTLLRKYKQCNRGYTKLNTSCRILALFGDQFARQFTSESLTWVDHFIFAMVPLGIITAITGAIRVQGMPLARAFIGRARENRALVEIELMSSTSGEVCEMFNGSSIVRAMGDPKIAQFLVFPEKYNELEKQYSPFDQDSMNSSTVSKPKDTTCGIYSLKEAEKLGLLRCGGEFEVLIQFLTC